MARNSIEVGTRGRGHGQQQEGRAHQLHSSSTSSAHSRKGSNRNNICCEQCQLCKTDLLVATHDMKQCSMMSRMFSSTSPLQQLCIASAVLRHASSPAPSLKSSSSCTCSRPCCLAPLSDPLSQGLAAVKCKEQQLLLMLLQQQQQQSGCPLQG